MLTPEDVLEDGTIKKEELLANIHYLSDRGLVELMIGYNPPMFAAARITAEGIDIVEDRFEFDLRFPPAPGEAEEIHASVPLLVERLVAEADFSALDGEKRKCLLRDVQYLRDELARPAERWRPHVVETILIWIEDHFNGSGESLPSLPQLKEAIHARRE